jgi:imidazolonepropionase-like amidohydrolase
MDDRKWRVVLPRAGLAQALVGMLSFSGAGIVASPGDGKGGYPEPVVALVGGTLIDGHGGAPRAGVTVLVSGQRIAAVGPKHDVAIPSGARVIDVRDRFILPGFIDSNVHVTYYGSDLAVHGRFGERQADVAIEGAQRLLRHGVTTARDSYGLLKPLLAARDAIARGEAVGARLLVAGNIVGWGGPWSLTFTHRQAKLSGPLTHFEQQVTEAITEGVGEELIELDPAALRTAMRDYVAKGVDFVKYGSNVHTPRHATTLIFSERAQAALVDEVHRAGKLVSVHAITLEGLRAALEAGVDIVQHIEAMDVPYSDELLELIVQRRVICSVQANMFTGPIRQWSLDFRAQNPKLLETPEHRLWGGSLSDVSRRNTEALIRRRCLITVATDAGVGEPREFARPRPVEKYMENLELGIATLTSIEGLVELGMTPGDAVTAATKNGAIACGALKDYGTVDVGKFADLLVLDGDPLADIRNIRKQSLVMKEGQIIDTASLPLKPVFSRVLSPAAKD